MQRAAKAFSFGKGEHRDDGQPINYRFEPGDEIPEDIASEIPGNLILENLAEDDPDVLTRDQLMMLAGLGDHPADAEPIEYNEEDLRDALDNLRAKGDVLEWFNVVRPGQTLLTNTDDQNRAEMVDVIVEELTGE